MVNTVQEAKIAIAAAKYPPTGNRSVGGGMHAMNFDTNAGDYFKHANDEILVVLQTESPEGVRNAEEIYSLPGVDAIFVGPNDLGFQMRTPEFSRSERNVGLRLACTCSLLMTQNDGSPKAGNSLHSAASFASWSPRHKRTWKAWDTRRQGTSLGLD